MNRDLYLPSSNYCSDYYCYSCTIYDTCTLCEQGYNINQYGQCYGSSTLNVLRIILIIIPVLFIGIVMLLVYYRRRRQQNLTRLRLQREQGQQTAGGTYPYSSPNQMWPPGNANMNPNIINNNNNFAYGMPYDMTRNNQPMPIPIHTQQIPLQYQQQEMQIFQQPVPHSPKQQVQIMPQMGGAINYDFNTNAKQQNQSNQPQQLIFGNNT